MTETQQQFTAVDLWQHIFKDERGYLNVWTGVRNDEDGKIPDETIEQRYFEYPRQKQEAADWAMLKAQEGREVFFCAHLLTRPKRNKKNAAKIIAIWSEFDGATIPNGSLKPTAVVESSPGHYHCYLRLTDRLPPEVAEEYNRRFAHAVGADPSGFDLSQLLRVPGTMNNKYPDTPIVRVVDISDRSYVPTELEASLPEIEEPRAEYEASEDVEEPPVVLRPEAMKVWLGEKLKHKNNGKIDRSASLLHIGRVLYDAGATRKVIIDALRERDITLGLEKYTNRLDSEKQYDAIYVELKANGRNPRVHIISGEGKEEQKPQLPEMDDAAYSGLFGEIVELIDPHTEADRVAVLMNTLTAIGNAMGRGAYMQVGATQHHTNLFCGIVGKTAKGRKGSSLDPVRNIMHAVDTQWEETRIASGLSSGEGLIHEVRNAITVPGKDGEPKIVDMGESDKRLQIVEGELSQALKVMKREGNTLSPTLRNAWDGINLRTMVRHSPLRATSPHISIIGHITQDELIRHLTETDMANGLANRFLWVLVKRSKSLPFGGEWHTVDVAPIAREMRDVLEFASHEFRMTWAEDAKELWCEAYELLTEDHPGIFGAITARAEAQTLRLSMLYALADRSREIHRGHVESALAVWEYAEQSARFIFGDRIGDPDADKVLAALRDAGTDGLTRTEVSALFGRNKESGALERILQVLLDAKKVLVTKAREGGSKRPIERWYAT